jgi:hypothetical protein
MAQRPEVLSKIFGLTTDRDEKDRNMYVDFLREASLAKRNPKGINVSMCWYEENFHTIKVRNCSLCTVFFFYAKVQSLQQKLKSNLFTSESGDSARDTLSFFEFLLFCRDFRIVPRLVTKDEVLFLWRVLITEKVRAHAQDSANATFLLNLDGFKDILCRIAILTYNKPGIRKMLVSTHGAMPSITDQITGLVAYLHLDDIKWVRNRVSTISSLTVSKINARSEGDPKNPQTRIDLRADLHAKRLSKLLSKGENSSATSTASPTGANVTDETDMSQVQDVANAVRFNVNGLVFEPGQQAYDGLAQEDDATQHRTPLDDLVDVLLGKGAYIPPRRKSVGSAVETPREGEGDENDPDLKSSLKDYHKAAQLGHTRRIHICASQELALSQYRISLSSILDAYADLLAYKRHKKSSDDLTEGKAVSQNFMDMGVVPDGTHCVIKLGITNRTSHDAVISVWTEGICERGEVRVTAMPSSMAPGLTKSVYVSFVAEELSGGRKNVRGVIHVQASHKQISRGSTSTHTQTLPSEFIVSCPVLLRVVRGDKQARSGSIQFPVCNENSIDRLSREYIPDFIEQRDHQLTYLPASNSFVLPSVPDFSSSAVARPHTGALNPSPDKYGFSFSTTARTVSSTQLGQSASGPRNDGNAANITREGSNRDSRFQSGVRDALPPPHRPKSAGASKKSPGRSGGKITTTVR